MWWTARRPITTTVVRCNDVGGKPYAVELFIGVKIFLFTTALFFSQCKCAYSNERIQHVTTQKNNQSLAAHLDVVLHVFPEVKRTPSSAQTVLMF